MTGASLYEQLDLFYLGREIDPGSGKTTASPLLYRNKHLTTHGAIIGMTGSGKTGLGVCLLEEAAIDRLPAIVIDPKGDMANLLLTFPRLRGEDFLPWVDPAKAGQKGVSKAELAEETARTWDAGIRSWDQDPERIARLKSAADFTVFTPGSSTGNPVSVLGNLDAPEPAILEDSATTAGIVNSTVSSLLGLIGQQADPLTSREHIMLSAVILHFWHRKIDLSLEQLISHVVNPPFDKIGVFALDTFYPQAKRLELAMQLNNILASPSFSSWIEGEPLRIDNMLYTPDGKPRVSIFSIAHLGESERMFFVTMLLGKMISWMRRQEGTDSLRCLLYMDEIFGFFPPLGNPPSKEPMLLLLKQARAYGLGIVLATQNPVDLDYKGLSNIGTWFIGRLQTKQDQDKVLAGISGSGAMGRDEARRLLADMRGRTFLMQSAHQERPVLFETRWVLSYLKGPISLAEIGRLTPERSVRVEQDDSKEQLQGLPSRGQLQTHPPLLTSRVAQRFVTLQVPASGQVYIPYLAAAATVRLFDKARGIDQQEEVRRKYPLTTGYADVDWSAAEENVVSLENTAETPAQGMYFQPLPATLSGVTTLSGPGKKFSDHLYTSTKLELLRVPALKLESEPGESSERFHQRVLDTLREKKDAEIDKIRQNISDEEETLNRRLEKVYARLEKEKSDVWARGVDSFLSFGIAVLGAFSGRGGAKVTTATRSARGVRSAGRVFKEKGDVRMVEDDARALESEIAKLAEELQARVNEITERWDSSKFLPPEVIAVTPRRADIFDLQVYLQWEPVWDPGSGKGAGMG